MSRAIAPAQPCSLPYTPKIRFRAGAATLALGSAKGGTGRWSALSCSVTAPLGLVVLEREVLS